MSKYIDHRYKKNDIVNLPKTVIDFGNYLETIKNKSPNTIVAYKKDLGIFFKFMLLHKKKSTAKNFTGIDIRNVNDKFIQSIKLDDLYAFMSYLQIERNNGVYARARKVATLKSYFNYLQGKALVIKNNPTFALESPQINLAQPVFLTVDQSKKLISSLDKNDVHYARDLCIITILLNTGIRLSEVTDIQLNRIKDDRLTIIGKGRKERTVYLNKACLKTIEEYLKVRKDDKANDIEKNYLFFSQQQQHISKGAIERLMKKHYINAELVDKKYVVHSIRHSFATRIYRKTGDIRAVQVLLGHKTIATTERYTHIDEDTLRNIVNDNEI